MHPWTFAGTIVVLLTLVPATVVRANDFLGVCTAFAESEAVFIGRAQPAVTRRISFEAEIDNARARWEAAKADLERFRAQQLHPSVVSQQDSDLQLKVIRAEDEYRRTRVMYPPPGDVVLVPMEIEKTFHGPSSSLTFVSMEAMDGLTLQPGRSYLVYGRAFMGSFLPEVVSAIRPPKQLDAVEDDLRFLETVNAGSGPILYGSLLLEGAPESPNLLPIRGVRVHLSADGYSLEIVTDADGTFVAPGVPAGMLQVQVDLPAHLTFAHGGRNPITMRVPGAGCPTLHLRASLNGRISGRVFRSDGSPFQGSVELVPIDSAAGGRNSSRHVIAEVDGEFVFSGVPPGTYLAGINLTRQPSHSSPYAPTYFPGVTERDQATPIVVGIATEHPGIEWSVGAPLATGELHVVLDTTGRPQKTQRVCVVTLNPAGRSLGGEGYERDLADRPLVIPVVDGVRYRLAAMARTRIGYEYSAPIEVTGSTGRTTVRLAVTGSSDIPKPNLCPHTAPE